MKAQLAPGLHRELLPDASPGTLVSFAFDVCVSAARDVDAAAECVQGADFEQLVDAQALARTADRLNVSAAELRQRSDYLKRRAAGDMVRDYDGSVPYHTGIAQWAGTVVGLAALQVAEAEKTLRQWARDAIARTAARAALPPGDLTESRREHVEQFASVPTDVLEQHEDPMRELAAATCIGCGEHATGLDSLDRPICARCNALHEVP